MNEMLMTQNDNSYEQNPEKLKKLENAKMAFNNLFADEERVDRIVQAL